MKSRYMQGLGWEIRADVREHNTGNMPMDLLVQYAQRKGEVCRKRHEEQLAESVCSTMYGPWVLNPSFFGKREWASR